MSKNRRPLPLPSRRHASFDERHVRITEVEYESQSEKAYQDGEKENRRNRRMRNQQFKRDRYS